MVTQQLPHQTSINRFNFGAFSPFIFRHSRIVRFHKEIITTKSLQGKSSDFYIIYKNTKNMKPKWKNVETDIGIGPRKHLRWGTL